LKSRFTDLGKSFAVFLSNFKADNSLFSILSIFALLYSLLSFYFFNQPVFSNRRVCQHPAPDTKKDKKPISPLFIFMIFHNPFSKMSCLFF
jgi:hypothetical protein